MIKCVIFDIDGTLANIDHRVQWVRSSPKNWRAFNRAMCNDTPNEDICDLLRLFYKNGTTVLLASGRSEETRLETEKWLNTKAGLSKMWTRLYMRKSGDFRADNIVKSEILDQMHIDGFKPTMVIDDRQQVVDMFRSRGLRVLQVDRGDF
jgi:hydroxymethylpyrimidine pyrophosphatase-like HAD family hydrolase